jgi:hypothetical protein
LFVHLIVLDVVSQATLMAQCEASNKAFAKGLEQRVADMAAAAKK